MSVSTTFSNSFDGSDYNPFSPIEVSDISILSDFNNNLGNILAYYSDLEIINDNYNVSVENDGVHIIADSYEENRTQGKKKRRNIYRWKRNVCKSLNAIDVEHLRLRGKHVMPRVKGPNCKCVHKCFTKVFDSEKSIILNIFNKIKHKEKQDTFLGGINISE